VRPLNAGEMRRMYTHPTRGLWRVIDGARDWSIEDPSVREANLIDQLVPVYGRPARGPEAPSQKPVDEEAAPPAPTLPEVITSPNRFLRSTPP
jgi:hypothetical protein